MKAEAAISISAILVHPSHARQLTSLSQSTLNHLEQHLTLPCPSRQRINFDCLPPAAGLPPLMTAGRLGRSSSDTCTVVEAQETRLDEQNDLEYTRDMPSRSSLVTCSHEESEPARPCRFDSSRLISSRLLISHPSEERHLRNQTHTLIYTPDTLLQNDYCTVK
jgi:hypothetical protein